MPPAAIVDSKHSRAPPPSHPRIWLSTGSLWKCVGPTTLGPPVKLDLIALDRECNALSRNCWFKTQQSNPPPPPRNWLVLASWLVDKCQTSASRVVQHHQNPNWPFSSHPKRQPHPLRSLQLSVARAALLLRFSNPQCF
jgi:hypothetical protein